MRKRLSAWRAEAGGYIFSAGQAVEEFAGGVELAKSFFLGSELRRVRDEAAAGATRGMFDVQHLVVKNILNDKLRHFRAIHAAIQQNLIGAGIVAAELSAPAAAAPSDYWALQ